MRFFIYLLITLLSWQITLFAQTPVINGFTPAEGPAGSTVIITGTGFGNNPAVFIGGTRAAVTASSATSISAIVPFGSLIEPIRVRRDSLTALSARPFAYSFADASGAAFTSNSLSGSTKIADNEPRCLADFDGDGKLDLVGVGANNRISILRNESSTTAFSLPVDTTLAFSNYAPFLVMAADFTGDGKPDLAYTYSNSSSIAILKNLSTAAGDFSFAAPYFYGIGTDNYASSITANDIDRDGKLDIVFGYSSSGSAFSVARNTGVGGNLAFATRRNFSYGTVPGGSGNVGSDARVVVTDVDGDGKPDVSVASRFFLPVLIYRNISVPGTIDFAAKVSISFDRNRPSGNGPFDFKMADLNKDGKPDIICFASDSLQVETVLNTTVGTNITFGTNTSFSTDGRTVLSMELNDFDGDAKPDVLLIGYGYLLLMKNTSTNNTPALSTAQAYNYTATPDYLLSGDMDNDGKPDIVVGGSTGGQFSVSSAYILRNQAKSPVILSVIPITAVQGETVTIRGAFFSDVTAVQFGGTNAASFTLLSDTLITAVVGAGSSGYVTAIAPYGTGRFGGFTWSLPIPVIDSFAPIKGPLGTPVTIYGRNFGTAPTDNLVYFGSGKAVVVSASDTALTVLAPAYASYEPVRLTVTPTHLSAASRIPFNTTFESNVTSFSNANFGDTVNYATPSKSVRTGTADFDQDGKPDIAASIYYDYSGVSVYKNNSGGGKPAFSNATSYGTSGAAPGGNATGVVYTAIADVDGDGKPDLPLISNGGYIFSVYRNMFVTDTFAFANGVSFSAGQNPTNVTAGDLDNDGKIDFAITNPYPSGRISILPNKSEPGIIQFAPLVEVLAESVPQQVLLQDFDNDGKLDMACTNYNAKTLALFRNTSTKGTISFAAKTNMPTGTGPIQMAASDLNADGRIDIVINNVTSKTISVYRNTSTPSNISFAARVDYTLPDFPAGLTIADMDGDGKPDVISGINRFPANLSLFKNTSVSADSIQFAPKVEISKINSPNNVFTTDVNGDGKPDIIAGLNTTDRITILRNIIGDPVPTSFCTFTDSTVLNAGLTGTNYQWQLNTGSGYVDISDGVNFRGTDSSKLVLKQIPSSWYGYLLRCVVDGRNGDAYAIKITARWQGGTSTAWENPANWPCRQLPDENTDVIIPAGTVIVNSNVVIRSLQVNRTANMSVATGADVKVLQ